MHAPLFVQILDRTLLPFIEEVFPSGQFMQDHNPNHMSTLGRTIMGSIGGTPHPSLWTSTPLKIFGMS